MKTLDRVFSWILVGGALLEGVAACITYRKVPVTLLWALCTMLFVLMLAGINLLRATRHADTALAWICFAGDFALAAAAFTFSILIGNVFDGRGSFPGVIALVLAGCSLNMAVAPRPLRG